MRVPQKTRYALRAVFELAKHFGGGPIKVAQIAKAQAIPARFLEVILNQLKQGGHIDSKRGKMGGYFLVHAPKTVTVGDVMRFMQGPIRGVGCYLDDSSDTCSLFGECVFVPMWERVRQAISGVCDGTTFQDLVEQEQQGRQRRGPSYSI